MNALFISGGGCNFRPQRRYFRRWRACHHTFLQMKRVLAGTLMLIAANVSAFDAVLNDCFTGATFVYGFDGNTQYCLEIDFPYRNGQPIYDWSDFYPKTRIEFLCLGVRGMRLKGTSEVDKHIGIGYCETIFIKAEKGTVISNESFYDGRPYFQHVNSSSVLTNDIISDYDITIATGSTRRKTIYLAFLTWSYGMWQSALGWIALEADSSIPNGGLYVVGSAFTTLGGPVTVGDAIPEIGPLIPPEDDPPVDYPSLLEGGIEQTDIYVDAAVAVSGDGCSWQSPFKSIQEGVDAVRLDGTIVHVKPGIYEPVQVDNSKFTLNDLTNTFTVESTEGPHVTIIQGGAISANINGCVAATHACFWYGDNPVDLYDTVRGFTLCSATHGGEKGRYENCIVSNCWFGLYDATAANCILVDNFRAGIGGGAIYNCVSTRNGYGTTATHAYNSIVKDNYEKDSTTYASYYHCCTDLTTPNERGNITNNPLFVNAETGDFRLRAGSPCIDTGTNEVCQSMTDFAGNRRIQGKRVDMGCYEYGVGTNGSTATTPVAVPYEWLERYATVPLDTADDYEMAAKEESGKSGQAGTPLPLWQEFVQGTVPTNANDHFQASISIDGEISISFTPCLPNRRYTLYGAPSLTGPWAWTDNFDDSDFISTNQFFKVGVELP